MKVLITGATGFVGSHLYDTLVDQGIECFGLARSEKKWHQFGLNGKPILGNLSKESITEWIKQLPEDITHIIHTAGIVHSFEDHIFDEINHQATKDLHEIFAENYPKAHFIFISSLAAAGPATQDRIKESDLAKPVSAYGRSKLAAESYLQKNITQEMKLTIIRPPMVIGPRDPAVLDIFKMVQGHFILNTGLNGSQKKYSIICVFDLVDLIIKAMKRTSTDTEIFYPSYIRDYQYNEIIKEIAQQLHKRTFTLPIPFPIIKVLASTLALIRKIAPHELRLTPDKINELAPSAWICDGTKATEILAMNYKWDLQRTVSETIKDYKERKWL